MVATRKEALEIAAKVRNELEKLYGQRLCGVYLYGSAARDQLTPVEEHEFTSQLGSDVSLEYDTLVTFLFASKDDYEKGRFAVHRNIKEEGIAA